jgi:hypothetical protein
MKVSVFSFFPSRTALSIAWYVAHPVKKQRPIINSIFDETLLIWAYKA